MYIVIIGANNISEQLIDWYSKYNHEITIIEKNLNKLGANFTKYEDEELTIKIADVCPIILAAGGFSIFA